MCIARTLQPADGMQSHSIFASSCDILQDSRSCLLKKFASFTPCRLLRRANRFGCVIECTGICVCLTIRYVMLCNSNTNSTHHFRVFLTGSPASHAYSSKSMQPIFCCARGSQRDITIVKTSNRFCSEPGQFQECS